MRVEFRATNIFDALPINEQIGACYETVITTFVDQVAQSIDVSKLSAIIIPEDFIAEVIAFQESIGEKPSVTKNGYAEALGKMLYDRNQDAYYVFLDSCIAQYILSDDLIAFFSQGVNQDTYLSRRKSALNMLAHEMVHISIYERIWAHNEIRSKSILSYLAAICFDEYCACRISNSLVIDPLKSSNHNQICELEKLIASERDKYKSQRIDEKQFADILFQYTELILKYMVYYIGAQHGQEQHNIDYAEGYIATVAPMFSRKLHRLFETTKAEESLTYKVISDLIVLYFDIMGIQMVEYESGFAIGIKEKRSQKNQ